VTPLSAGGGQTANNILTIWSGGRFICHSERSDVNHLVGATEVSDFGTCTQTFVYRVFITLTGSLRDSETKVGFLDTARQTAMMLVLGNTGRLVTFVPCLTPRDGYLLLSELSRAFLGGI